MRPSSLLFYRSFIDTYFHLLWPLIRTSFEVLNQHKKPSFWPLCMDRTHFAHIIISLIKCVGWWHFSESIQQNIVRTGRFLASTTILKKPDRLTNNRRNRMFHLGHRRRRFIEFGCACSLLWAVIYIPLQDFNSMVMGFVLTLIANTFKSSCKLVRRLHSYISITFYLIDIESLVSFICFVC